MHAKIFDTSKSKIGFQGLQKSIWTIFDFLSFDNYEKNLQDYEIRILPKKTLECFPPGNNRQEMMNGQATMNGLEQATTTGWHL